MKPTINLKHGESASMAIIRLHKHIRRIDRRSQPDSQYAERVKARRAQLRVVK